MSIVQRRKLGSKEQLFWYENFRGNFQNEKGNWEKRWIPGIGILFNAVSKQNEPQQIPRTRQFSHNLINFFHEQQDESFFNSIRHHHATTPWTYGVQEISQITRVDYERSRLCFVRC
jgi:hypothetical protein